MNPQMVTSLTLPIIIKYGAIIYPEKLRKNVINTNNVGIETTENFTQSNVKLIFSFTSIMNFGKRTKRPIMIGKIISKMTMGITL